MLTTQKITYNTYLFVAKSHDALAQTIIQCRPKDSSAEAMFCIVSKTLLAEMSHLVLTM